MISLVPGAEEEGKLQENLDEKPHPHYQVDHVHRGRDETREYHLGKVIIIIIFYIKYFIISHLWWSCLLLVSSLSTGGSQSRHCDCPCGERDS